MTVVLSDVDGQALELEVARLSVAFSDQISGQVCDVTDNDAVVRLANSVRDRHGPVHVLCNNAGVAPAAPILQSTPSQWKWTFDINVLGVAHGVLAFVPQMVEAGIGHVVNTASQAGLATNTRCGVYAASKHAVVGLSEALYRELEGTSIGVSCLCPNAVATSIFDVARLRPGWVEVTEDDDDIQEAFSGVVRDNGIAPALVADEVVEAVQTGKFWVFTHQITKHIALSRLEDIETGCGPSPNPQDLTRVAPTH